jgi:hypothetical protein
MANLPIDLDQEAVQYDGSWYTRDELARKIKTSLENGDYAISRPSQALEYLTAQLGATKLLSFKVTEETAELLKQAATRSNRTSAAILRDALAAALSISRDPIGKRPTEPELPAVTTAAPPPLPAAPSNVPPGLAPSSAAAPSAPIAGPGAIRNAGGNPDAKVIIEQPSAEEVASAVDLQPKKKADDADVERRWFGG